MALVQGAVGSSNYSSSSRLIDGGGKLYFNNRRFEFPLISFLGLMGRADMSYQGQPLFGEPVGGVKNGQAGKASAKREVKNAQFTMFADEAQERSTQVNNAAGYSSSATSIVVDDGSLFVANDTILVPRTGEMMFVSARSSNTLTVVRGVGSTGQALVDNDYMVRVSSAYPVNALSGTAKATVPTETYNYTQIFRTPVQIGRTDKLSALNFTPGSDEERLLKEAGYDHLLSQEMAFWYGRRNEAAAIDSSGTRQRTTGGIFQWVTSNVTDISGAGGILTESLLDSFAEQAFDRGSSEKFLFCSPRVLSKINALAKDRIRINDMNEKKYGLNLAELETSHGKFMLVRTAHFGRTGLASTYASQAVAIDPEQIKYAYLGQAENELRLNIQENDRDGFKHEWLAECGLQVTNETTHAILKGVNA